MVFSKGEKNSIDPVESPTALGASLSSYHTYQIVEWRDNRLLGRLLSMISG
jgi:hypothetical protein